MLCERCKHDVPEGARFCPRCGNEMLSSEATRVDVPTAEGPPETRPYSAPPPAAPTPGPPPPEAPPSVTSPDAPPPQTPFQTPATAKAPPGWSVELKEAWGRVGSPRLGVALGLALGALLLSLIGLIVTSTATPFGADSYHGFVWASFGSVLSVLALAAFAAARSDGGVWSADRDLKIGTVLALVALLIGLIGLIVDYSVNEPRAAATGPIWASFADVWAFGAFGWLVYTRPVGADRGLKIAVGCGCAAVVLAIVGMAVGLGNTPSDFAIHGPGWFGWASVWAVLSAAAVLGRRTVS